MALHDAVNARDTDVLFGAGSNPLLDCFDSNREINRADPDPKHIASGMFRFFGDANHFQSTRFPGFDGLHFQAAISAICVAADAASIWDSIHA
jgi:hypothetical protein